MGSFEPDESLVKKLVTSLVKILVTSSCQRKKEWLLYKFCSGWVVERSLDL